MEGLSILLKSSQQAGKITGIKVSRLVKILHIFFVDDILIATRADSQEWLEIDSILKFFCRASGLQINATKSTLHYSGLTEVDIELYKNIFSYNFLEISIGLRYLGYFLKPDCYKVTDWHWILIKFEKRITHWCNRWLSLGGRFVLIKSVLESQAVYWMALAAIPGTILKRIRQLIFSFLWTSGSANKHLHLCHWESIAKPKSVGGWGLRNIFLFNQALASKSLWRVLSQDGIWHRVITGKYITHLTISMLAQTYYYKSNYCFSDLEITTEKHSYHSTLAMLETRIGPRYSYWSGCYSGTGDFFFSISRALEQIT
jgi:hypothetical protein